MHESTTPRAGAVEQAPVPSVIKMGALPALPALPAYSTSTFVVAVASEVPFIAIMHPFSAILAAALTFAVVVAGSCAQATGMVSCAATVPSCLVSRHGFLIVKMRSADAICSLCSNRASIPTASVPRAISIAATSNRASTTCAGIRRSGSELVSATPTTDKGLYPLTNGTRRCPRLLRLPLRREWLQVRPGPRRDRGPVQPR